MKKLKKTKFIFVVIVVIIIIEFLNIISPGDNYDARKDNGEQIMSSKCLKIKRTDTIVIGFPKSGTTWVEEITWLIQNDLNFEKAKSIDHYSRVAFIDKKIYNNSFIENMNPPRVFKTHLFAKNLPKDFNKNVKVVYVIRNPKDVLVSYYNFFRLWKPQLFIGTFEELFELFINGKTYFGSWFDHVNEFTSLENVHIIHYEDLIEDPMKTLKDLANYLGKKLDERQIRMLISFVAFDNMKTYLKTEERFILKESREQFEFFKNGKIGNWKNYLSSKMSQQIDDMITLKLTYRNRDLIRYEPNISQNKLWST